MKPYYEDDLVTLYHGDALEVAEWLGADVLVTDPPYGMDYTGFGGRKGEPRRNTGRLAIANDLGVEVRDAAVEAWGPKPALVFGRWNIARPSGTRMRLIWDKTPCGFMGDLAMPWGGAEEEIYVLGSGFVGKREANIIRAQTLMSSDARRPDHPTPKPVALMEALIAKCPPGVIADPFAGSGATLIAARNLGRRAIGVEMEQKYCDLIVSRLAQQAFDFGDWDQAS
jgi:DNA modification methylase